MDLGGLLMGVGGTDGYFSGDENMLPVFPSGNLASHLSILIITSRLYTLGELLNVLCGFETSFRLCSSILVVACAEGGKVKSRLRTKSVGRSEEASLLCNGDEEFGAWMAPD